MSIHPNPRRTRLLLRIRRLLTKKQRANRPDWPEETITQLINEEIATLRQLPMSKIRLVATTLGNPQ